MTMRASEMEPTKTKLAKDTRVCILLLITCFTIMNYQIECKQGPETDWNGHFEGKKTFFNGTSGVWTTVSEVAYWDQQSKRSVFNSSCTRTEELAIAKFPGSPVQTNDRFAALEVLQEDWAEVPKFSSSKVIDVFTPLSNWQRPLDSLNKEMQRAKRVLT